VKSFHKKKEDKLCKYKTFHFIITNQDGEKKYITSILFKVKTNHLTYIRSYFYQTKEVVS
jgi:hypothetical protein